VIIVPLIGTGVKSKSAVVDSQRRLNCYLEPQMDVDKTPVAVFGTPGLTNVADRGASLFRGGVTEGVVRYEAQGNAFYSIDNAFTFTDLNAASRLTTTVGRVSAASSGAVVVLADGTNGYNLTISGAVFAQIASSMFANPKAVTWQDGQFLASFDETGSNKKRCQISADGVTWNALDFRAVESTPGALLRPYSFGGEVHQFCETGIEFWAYTGDPTFPFQPIRGATLNVGLAARWSVAESERALFFLGRKKGSGVSAYELIGHQARSITPPGLANLWGQYATKGDATGRVFSVDEHTFYVLSFPTVGKTWMYDAFSSELLGTPVWSELSSANGRHFGDLGFELVERSYVTDYRVGKIHRIDETVYTDAGSEIAWEIVTRHFFQNYDRVTVDELAADFETGVGLPTGQGSDPQVMLTVSRDGGRTWGSEMSLPLGAVGAYTTKVSARRLGTARDFVFKLRISDPVRRILTGLGIRATPHGV
jgi:hypothetical protein